MALTLQKLTLKRFGIHLDKIVEFDEGLNILKAANGNGKTSIIQAIKMLLVDAYEGPYEDYINWNSNDFFISLLFAINAVNYEVSLSCVKQNSSNKTTRILTNKDTGIDLGTGEEAKNVLATLINPVIGTYSLVCGQKTHIDNIVSCKDSERRDLFKKIKDIDYEKEVKETIDVQIDILKNSIIELDKEIYRLEHADYLIKDIQPLPFTQEEYIALLTKQTELVEALTLLKQKKDKKLEEEKELEEAKSVITLNTTALDNVKKDISLNSIEEYIPDLQEEILHYQATAKKEHNDSIEKIKSDAQGTIDSLQRRITEEQDKSDGYTKELETIKVIKLAKYNEDSLLALRNTLASLMTEKQIEEKHKFSFEQGICPTCNKPCSELLEESIKKIEALENNIQAHRFLITKEQDIKAKREQEIEDQNKLVTRKNELQALIDSCLNVIQMLNTSLENTKKDRDTKIKEKEDSLPSLLESIIKEETSKEEIRVKHRKAIQTLLDTLVKEETRLTLQIKDKQNEQAILEKKVSEYDSKTDDALEALKASKEETENKITSYKDTKSNNEQIKSDNENVEKQKLLDKKSLEDKNKTKVGIQKSIFNNEQARTILLKDFPNFVIDSSVGSIEMAMNSFIDDIYYKSLNVALRATKTAIKLEYGTGQRKVPAFKLSGAEAKIVNISFLNNFNNISGLSCLILDEPDEGMSDETAEVFYESLLQIQDKYKQVIIITHNEKMKNYLSTNASPQLITW
jgi:Fe-S cluster assembly ATPase SufC